MMPAYFGVDGAWRQLGSSIPTGANGKRAPGRSRPPQAIDAATRKRDPRTGDGLAAASF